MNFLAQLPGNVPMPETNWQFWAVIAYLTIQSLTQLYQLRQAGQLKAQTSELKKQTDGLVTSSVAMANKEGLARGQIAGAITEQARVAAKLAVADEVAARLESIKQGSTDPSG